MIASLLRCQGIIRSRRLMVRSNVKMKCNEQVMQGRVQQESKSNDVSSFT